MKNSAHSHKNNSDSYYLTYIFRLVFLLLALQLSFISLKAQNDRLSISLRDTTLEAALNIVRELTDVSFVYNHEVLSNSPKITVSFVDKTIGEALEIILRGTGLKYEQVNGTFVITPIKEETRVPQAQPKTHTQTIRGKVVDRESKITLPFASVVVLNSDPQVGTTTDQDGNFALENLPVGRYTLQISYMGYEKAVLPEIQLGSAKEVYITAEISEAVLSIGEIAVSVKKGEPLNEMATVSAKSFSVEETKRYAASIGDPARMAQVFAGVSGSDDASNEIVIRGNSPNWMLWRMEGVEIPSPNHFAEEGYSAGAVSILNTATLGTSDFYTGAFPGEYGNALSGVFDIKLRNGNTTENEYAFEVGLLGVEASVEGPFKKGYSGSYLFNYRYSSLAIINAMNLDVFENSLPSYQDLSFKVNLPTKKAGTFSIWGIGGNATDDQQYLPDTTLGEKLKYGYKDLTKTGMYATGITHTIFPDQKSYIKTVLSHSQSFSSETYDQMDSLGIINDDYYDDLRKGAIRVTSFYNRKISKQFTLRTGGIISVLDYDYLTRSYEPTGASITHVDSRGVTNLYQVYLQGKYKFSDKVALTGGLHYTHFALNKENVLEPRVGMRINLPNRQKLTAGFGMHSRHENLPVYFVEFENLDGSVSQLNKNLKLTRSNHYVLGYEKMFGRSLNVKTEVYYQSISNLAVPNNPDKYWAPMFGGINREDTLASIGEGRNYGIELTIQKYFTNNYYFLITSSLFDAKYKAADGEWRNSLYNTNYTNNFVGGKEISWGDNKMFGINTKIIFSGGKRMIPIDLDASIEEGETVYKDEEMFSYKGPAYFRIDLGMKLHFFREKTEHIISIDVQNLTNRLNTWTEIYDAENEEIIEFPMAGIIPIISYRIEF